MCSLDKNIFLIKYIREVTIKKSLISYNNSNRKLLQL